MNKYLHGILMCLMTLVVLFSCTKPEPNEPSINLYVTPSTLDFDEEGGSKNVTIKTNATSWTASASSQDIRLSATSGSGDGTLTVSMGPSHSSQNTEVQSKLWLDPKNPLSLSARQAFPSKSAL